MRARRQRLRACGSPLASGEVRVILITGACNLGPPSRIQPFMQPMPSSAAAPPDPARPLEFTDSEAVQAVIGGDREMFEVIVRRYNTQLYRVGMAYLRNHAQAEDAMQNAYLKAFLNLRRFRGHSGFGTWLTRIMINECLMTIRSRERAAMENLDDQAIRTRHETVAFAPAGDPLRSEEVKAVLELAIQALPRMQRAVYMLREVQGFSTLETAKSVGISAENVKVTLHRAREALKARLLQSTAAIELFKYPAEHCDPMTRRVMLAVRTMPATAR